MSVVLSDFNQNWDVLTNSIKIPNMKFHKNPSDGNHTVSCEEQTDMTRHCFANAPTNNTTTAAIWD
jgi:hypothetical protein